jgi:hypothetical protein
MAGKTKERAITLIDFSSRSSVVAVIWAKNNIVRVYL